MKLNTETFYESNRLINKLKQLPDVTEVLLNNNRLLLVKKRNNRLVEVIESLVVEPLVLDNLTYLRLNDTLGLLNLSRKTKKDGDDEMYLIGDEDDTDVEVVDRGLLTFDKGNVPKPKPLRAKSKLLQTKKT